MGLPVPATEWHLGANPVWNVLRFRGCLPTSHLGPLGRTPMKSEPRETTSHLRGTARTVSMWTGIQRIPPDAFRPASKLLHQTSAVFASGDAVEFDRQPIQRTTTMEPEKGRFFLSRRIRSIAALLGLGMLLPVALSSRGGTLELDFNSDPAGIPGAQWAGTNPKPWFASGGNPGGFLALSHAAPSQYTVVVLPNIDPGAAVTGFSIAADLRVGNPSSGGVSADGFGLSFVREGDPLLESPDDKNQFAGALPESGGRTGVSILFDTWSGNTFPGDPSDPTDIQGLIVRVDNATVKKVAMPVQNGTADDPASIQTGPHDASYWNGGGDPYQPGAWSGLAWRRFTCVVTPEARLTLTWKGATLINNLQLPYSPTPSRWVLSSRTGAANEAVHVDNLRLVTTAQPIPPAAGPVGNLRTTEIGSERVVLAWDAATVPGQPGSPLVYDVLRDGVLIASRLSTSSYTDRNALPDRSYVYGVHARNIGNVVGAESTLTVRTRALMEGVAFLRGEIWHGMGDRSLEEALSDSRYQSRPPDEIRYLNGFSFGESSGFGNTFGDQYLVRVKGVFTAPKTARYRFFIRSDRQSALYFNANGATPPDPAQAVLIARESACCRGFQDVVEGVKPEATSVALSMVAGQKYGLTFVVKASNGPDWGQVAVREEGDRTPAQDLTPLRGSILSGPVDGSGAASVTMVRQPVSLSTSAYGVANFSATVSGASPYEGDYGPGRISYQWYKNDLPILNANGPSFSLTQASPDDNGARFHLVASVAGASVRSQTAVLTVPYDNNIPTVFRMTGSDTFDSITILFSEPVSDSALNPGYYQISGLSLTSGVRLSDRRVRFSTSPQLEGASYPATVAGVSDLVGRSVTFNGIFHSFRFQPGRVLYRRWKNRSQLPSDPAVLGDPDETLILDQFAVGPSNADPFVGQMKAVFIPESSGGHVFHLSSDNRGELYLGADANQRSRFRIAEEPVGGPRWVWDGGPGLDSVRGGSGARANRSDQYPRTGWPAGPGGAISLMAGRKYYLELIHRSPEGEDHAEATVSRVGGPDPAPGATSLVGGRIGWFFDPNELAARTGDNLRQILIRPEAPLGRPIPEGWVIPTDPGDFAIAGPGLVPWPKAADPNQPGDVMQFYYEEVTGDFDRVVRIKEISGLPTLDYWAGGGLQARVSTDALSPSFAIKVASPGNHMSGITVAGRAVDGQDSTVFGRILGWAPGGMGVEQTLPNQWIRLRRVGDWFAAYVGIDGKTWSMVGQRYQQWPARLLVGTYASAANLETGVQSLALMQFSMYGEPILDDASPPRLLSLEHLVESLQLLPPRGGGDLRPAGNRGRHGVPRRHRTRFRDVHGDRERGRRRCR
jgi:hypothetical protein